MSKFELYRNEDSCASCPLFPEMCFSECKFADKKHVDPNEIIPDELIPWLKGKING